MKLNVFRRLIKEDFAAKDQPLIEKIAYSINPVFESLTNIFSNGINFEDNFSAQIKQVTVTVDANGTPISGGSFQTTLKSQAQNIIVTRATNVNSPTTYVTAAPFISFTNASEQITINNIVGLQPNTKYLLRLLVTT